MNIESCLNIIPFIFLTVSCNFTGNLLSCKNQELFTNNIYTKHIILFFILLITMVYTNKSNFVKVKDKPSFKDSIYPLILHSILIYITFLFMTKMDMLFLILGLFILLVHLMIDNYNYP